MLLDSCLESLVGNIDPEVFLQLAEDMVLELIMVVLIVVLGVLEGNICLLYTSPSPRDS